MMILYGFSGKEGTKYPSGAPAGYTGSPGDGQNCTASGCHSGSATSITGWITTNVPASGYVSGSTYNITVTVPGDMSMMKGFEVSPQKTDGTLLGILAAGTGSKLVGSGKYVTHNAAMAANPAVWTFSWTAPPAGSGTVTFYGAFAVSFGSTYVSSTVVTEAPTGVEPVNPERELVIYPVPVRDRVTLSYTLVDQGHVEVSLYDVCGNMVSRMFDGYKNPGDFTMTFPIDNSIRPGIYFLNLTAGDKDRKIQKLVIQ